MSFNYSINEEGDIVIVYFDGRILDRSEADEMMDKIEDLIESGKHNFIVDFSKIDYMSSAGLNVLISLLTQTRNRYGDLVICEVPEKVKKLLVTSKLQNIFTIVESQEEALKKFQK